jgi:Ni,Fe-hydrogenase III component G
MNISASLTLVQGPSTVTCMVVTSLYHNFPTDFISSLQRVKASVNTNLCTEFLLQIWKQQEDSAMLLASNKQPNLNFSINYYLLPLLHPQNKYVHFLHRSGDITHSQK